MKAERKIIHPVSTTLQPGITSPQKMILKKQGPDKANDTAPCCHVYVTEEFKQNRLVIDQRPQNQVQAGRNQILF